MAQQGEQGSGSSSSNSRGGTQPGSRGAGGATGGRRPRILVLGAGGAPGISCIKALLGEDLELFSAGHGPYMPGLYMVAQSFVVPRATDRRFVPELATVVEAHGIDVVIPTFDVELIAIDRRRELLDGVCLAMAPSEALQTCLDKWQFHQRLEGAGIPLPKAWLGSEAARQVPGAAFPVIVKPRTASGSEGVSRVHSGAGLTGVDDSMIVQEELPGEEVSVDVYVNRWGAVLAAVPRVRLNTELGVSVCGRTMHHPELENLARDVAREVGIRGMANVQFKQGRDGSFYLLEVNARCPGGMALTVASGANLPAMAVRELLGADLTEQVGFEELAMVRYRQEIFMAPDELLDGPVAAGHAPMARELQPERHDSAPAMAGHPQV